MARWGEELEKAKEMPEKKDKSWAELHPRPESEQLSVPTRARKGVLQGHKNLHGPQNLYLGGRLVPIASSHSQNVVDRSDYIEPVVFSHYKHMREFKKIPTPITTP